MPENSRNSLVDLQSQKDSKKTDQQISFLLKAEMLYFLLRICLSECYFYPLFSNNLQLE